MPAPTEAFLSASRKTITHFCYCWKLTRKDGEIFGFTDHDRAIIFNGQTYQADSGYAASDVQQATGFAIDTSEILGALDSNTISEADIKAGLWDSAKIELYIVDWQNTEIHHLQAKYTLGEITRSGRAFTAECRSLMTQFNQARGKTYTHNCAAKLGDESCKIDLNDSQYFESHTIYSLVSDTIIKIEDSSPKPQFWFDNGTVEVTSGTLQDRKYSIKQHLVKDTIIEIKLWQSADGLQAGDSVKLSAGCNKTFATCQTKFNNAVNFQGFPHIPGNDYLMRYAVNGDQNLDGQPTR